MSFYGNIANGGKTNLTFDKIYPNRMQMDQRAETDGIFVGRFVLVEYDDNTFSRRIGFMTEEDIPVDVTASYTIYSDTTYRVPYRITKSSVKEGYHVYPGDIVVVEYRTQKAFFNCLPGNEGDIAVFNLITLGDSYADSNDYTLNYNVDKKNYTSTFVDGWDSTIWQKVVENGDFKYIMIGDLNSKVPRFYVKSEAPTEEPIAPHFDSNSTNMDYTLHVQPNWGFRIKKATATKGNEENPILMSDTEVNSKYIEYNAEEDKTTTLDSYSGAIYFNKDGFNPLKRSYDSNETIKNEILLEPTGISGNKYCQHNDIEIQTAREDIQELTIHLPAIGNAISDLWDLMYGDKQNGEFLEDRNLDIDWESKPEPERKGVRMVREDLNAGGFSYDDEKVATVAGCINSVHDLMGMIILEGDTKLADADTEHIYYGKMSGSSRNGYFMKTRKNTYTPLAHEDLEDYINSKKYMDLTQYQKGEYHTKTGNNYYEELDDKPTPNANYYIVSPTLIQLKEWVTDPIINPDLPEDEAVILNHYWKDEDDNYIKDLSLIADAEKDYYTLTPIRQTYGKEYVDKHPSVKIREIYKPEPRVEVSMEDGSSYYRGYLYFDIIGYQEDGITPIYGDKVYELVPQLYTEEGNPQYDEEGKPVFGEAEPLKSDAIYFLTDYKILPATDMESKDLIYAPCDITEKPFNSQNMPTKENENAYEIEFLDFNEEGVTYYLEDEFDGVTGYRRLKTVEDYDKSKIYYTIIAEAETGELDIVTPEGQTPPENPETIFTHYYIPGKYHYKQGHDDYIFGTEEKMIPNVEYYIVESELQDIIFYEPTKYYYEKEVSTTVDGMVVTEKVKILDNDTIMKTKDTVLEDNEKILSNKDGLVYFLAQEAYIVNDPSGILSAGSIWNSGSKIPASLELGKLYQGEDIDINGNIVPAGTISNDEKAERMFQWKELEGFARTLNTIHGLILKLNQYFKFDDTLTRDRTTIQGSLNCINDIINDFATLVPGEIAVIDEYGRIKSATLFTTATDESDEEGWISVVVDPNAIETKITIRHNDAKTPKEILGQTNDQNLIFGDTFKALSFGIDDKGHIDETHFKEFTMRMPNLKVTDNDTKQIVTDFEVGESGQALVISRENVGNFTLVGYTGAGSTTDIGATDTVNQAFGKLQTKLNKEIEDRIADVDIEEQARINAINALDMDESASETQFISKISQTDGKLSVTRAAAGTLNLGSGYTIAEAAADIDENDSINSAFGKVAYKLKVLNGSSTEAGSVAYQIAQIVAGADAKYDTLKEIADWIINDEIGVATINSNIAKLQELVGDKAVATQITEAITAALVGDTEGTLKYALASDLTDLASRVTNLEALIDVDKVADWNTQADWAEASETSPAFIKNKPDLENLVKTTTEFSYTYNETTTQLTIDGLMAYIAELEKRIYDLEHPTESDPGTIE